MDQMTDTANDSYTINCTDIDYYNAQYGRSDWTTLIGVRAIVGILYSLIFFVGIIGNAGVIVRVINDKKLHSAQYIFLLNLMFSDFLLCLTSVPFSPIAIIMKRWIFGGILCKAVPLGQAMSVVITSLSLTTIAIDKYWHVVLDATKPPLALGPALVVVGAIWAVAVALSLPLVLSYGVEPGTAYLQEHGVSFCGYFCDEWSTPEYRKAYGTAVMTIQFLIPMILISYCYSSIMRKVQRDMMIENKQFAESLTNVQRLEAMRRKRKVTYILIMMVLAFIGCWAPMTLFNIFRDYNLVPEFIIIQQYFWAILVNCMASSSVIWNPLLFFWLTGRKKRGSRRLSLITDSAIVSFLLAMNPLRTVFKRRSTKCDAQPTTAARSTISTDSNDRSSGSEKKSNTSQTNTMNGGKNALFASRKKACCNESPSMMLNTFTQKSPHAQFMYYSNGKKRSLPASLECYRLLHEQPDLHTIQAPRATVESLDDGSPFHRVEKNTNDEKMDSQLSFQGDGAYSLALIKKHKTSQGSKKSLVYVHLGQSAQF